MNSKIIFETFSGTSKGNKWVQLSKMSGRCKMNFEIKKESLELMLCIILIWLFLLNLSQLIDVVSSGFLRNLLSKISSNSAMQMICMMSFILFICLTKDSTSPFGPTPSYLYAPSLSTSRRLAIGAHLYNLFLYRIPDRTQYQVW